MYHFKALSRLTATPIIFALYAYKQKGWQEFQQSYTLGCVNI